MHPPDSTLRVLKTIHRTVVVVDLVGYSTVARVLEENTSAVSVAELNRRIQGFIREALSSIPTAAHSLLSETGDGAILLFEAAENAHNFAECLHRNSEKHNTTRTESSAHRLFRIGIATGEIVVDGDEVKSDHAGITIANAARLESAARPGEIVIDTDTFKALPLSVRESYSDETTVRGKRDEVFRVRKYMAVEVPTPAPQVVTIAKSKIRQRSLRFKVILTVGVAVVVLSGVSFATWRFYPRVQPFSSISTEQLTDSGDITGLAISPDGKTLAEVKTVSGQNSVWMRNISTEKEIQILAPVRLNYGSLTISKDSNEVFFVREDADQSGSHTLYSIPVFGGEPRLLVRNLGLTVALSPDDQRVALIRASASANEVHIVDLATGEDKEITNVEGHYLSSPVWSPDGLSLAWLSLDVSADGNKNHDRPIMTIRSLGSRKQRDVSFPPNISVSRLNWLPSGKQMLLSFNKTWTGSRDPGSQVGLVSIDSGDFRQVSNDMIAHSGLALSADGMKIATLLQQNASEVSFYTASGTDVGSATRLPRLASGLIWLSEDKLLVDEGLDHQILSRDNNHLIDLKLMFPSGHHQYGAWTSNASVTTPAACPGGDLLFTGSVDKVDQLYLIDSHGQFVRLLARVQGADIFCSPDNNFAYYSVPDTKDPSIWKVPLAGGEPSKVMSITHDSPIAYSSDGRFAAYLTDSAGQSTATIIDLNQRTVVGDIALAKHAPGTFVHFTPDESALTFVEQQDQGFALASRSIHGSITHMVTSWFRDPIVDFAWSPSGKWLVLLWDRSISDVALIQDNADKTRD